MKFLYVIHEMMIFEYFYGPLNFVFFKLCQIRAFGGLKLGLGASEGSSNEIGISDVTCCISQAYVMLLGYIFLGHM